MIFDESKTVIGFDVQSSTWEEYKKMVDDIYYNQKTRSQLLDNIHRNLESIGNVVEATGFEHTADWMDQICLKMKEYVYSGLDKNSDPIKLDRNLSIPIPNGLDETTGRKVAGVIKDCFIDAYFNPQEVYHYLD